MRETRFSVLIVLGWCCLGLSSVFLYFSIGAVRSGGASSGIWIMVLARLLGISGFIIGLVEIFNERWLGGTALLFFSILLPLISVVVHGTL